MGKPVYNIGDVIDKLTILTMKVHFGDEESISEHRYLTQGLKSYGINGEVLVASIRLQLMNRLIWELENEMRRGLLDNNLEETGRRAIKIREHNKKRIEYKNKLNTLLKGFTERKVQHGSC